MRSFAFFAVVFGGVLLVAPPVALFLSSSCANVMRS